MLHAAAVVSLLAGGVSLASTGTASASACTHPAWSDADKSGSGYGTVTSGSGTPIKTGPNSDCGTTAWVPTSTLLYYHCYVVNSAGNTWTNVRIDGTQIVGWVWDAELSNGGSYYHC